MKLDEFLKKNNDLLDKKEIVSGFFDCFNKNDFNFRGIYVISDSYNDGVYLGSAYAKTRTVGKRLAQYLSETDTGNTLADALLRNKKATSKSEAILVIKTYKIIAFEHKDLEYDLINATTDLMNDSGNH